jgi:hypothetical protein
MLAAHRSEFIEAGPDASRDVARGVLRLRPESLDELKDRVSALLTEFSARQDPDGDSLSYLWSLVARPAGAPGSTGSAPG